MSAPQPHLPAWRTSHHEQSGEWPSAGIAALLERRVQQTPDRLFIVDGATRLSFAAMAARAGSLAAGLTRLGIGPGEVISWQLPSWWEAAAVALAIDWIGAVSNPILPIYREREVGFIARQAGARLLIVPGVFRGFDYLELARGVRRDSPRLEHLLAARAESRRDVPSLEALMGPATPPPRAPRGAYEVSSLFYTSGTTAEPKGVMHTDSTLGAFAQSNIAISGGSGDDVGLLQFPLTHIGGIGAFLAVPLLRGSRVVYLDVWTPERALQLIESEGVTSAGGPPAILQGLMGAKGFDPARVGSLRIAGTGAADIPPELVREVGRRLGAISYRSYGLTECPMLTSGAPDDSEDNRAGTDGRPAPGCRVRIAGDDGGELPPGTEGEILAFGPQLCVGYADPRLNTEAFTADGFLRTGDLGIADEKGYLRITGRKKDIIIRKGENLSARAIEDVLYEHPAVADAAVIGVADTASGERVCACVVLRPGSAPVSLGDLRRFMEGKQVMRQKIPEQLEILAELPRNATGKVLKWELRKKIGAG